MNLRYLIGGGILVLLIPFDFLVLLDTRWFYSGLVASLVLAGMPVFLGFLSENRRQKEIEEKFLEYIRALVEGVKSGLSISGVILSLKDEDYGALSPYIRKLGNQLEWGVAFRDALIIFAKDTRNDVIRRAVDIVIEAEESGGSNMEDVLQSVTESVIAIKRMKSERKSSTYSQMVQGYIVFFVFIGIMLIVQVYLLPMMSGLNINLSGGVSGLLEENAKKEEINLDNVFLSMIIVQGFFAGLMIGEFSEGSIKYGVKHSVLLLVIALLIMFTVVPPGG